MLKSTPGVWIRAVRLRTLPLSIAGIVVGNALCINDPRFSWTLFILMIITAMLFQIVSNLANDLGDGLKGTDNEQRIGPKRIFQSGLLTQSDLKKGIFFILILAIIFAMVIIFKAFGLEVWLYLFVFFGLTLFSIWAAIYYTIGNRAYGYKGWGDFFVFLFFGGLSVMGSYFVQVKELTGASVSMSCVVGALSVAVLNLNNMRDRVSDANAGKRTLVVLLGDQKAKVYHFLLVCGALLTLIFNQIQSFTSYFWLPLLVIIPLLFHLQRVFRFKEPSAYDPELKKVALTTFGLSLLFLVNMLIG